MIIYIILTYVNRTNELCLLHSAKRILI